MPKVSVVMPAYNAEKYIQEAIDSILNQTFTDFEFIIIDDGSTDRTVDIIKSYTDPRIRFYQNEQNMGVASTLNRGLDLSTGEYIARMDSDDISLPERFDKQVAYMDTNPGVAVVGAGIQLFGAKHGKRLFSPDYERLKVDLLFGCCFAHPAVMMRSACFGNEKVQYDENFNKMEDFDLWVRTAEIYEMASLQDVLLKYRIHPNQVTQAPSAENKQQLRKLKIRQMAQLGIEPSENGFEEYIKYCLGEFEPTETGFLALSAFFSTICNQNKKKQLYDDTILNENLNAVLSGLLSAFPLSQAISMANRCHLRGIKYGTRRLIRGAIAKVWGAIRIRKQKSKLKSKDFSIISNNCWGSFTYQKYGLEYTSPTAGLYILGHDFVKLCSNWKWYMEQKLQFIPWETATYHYAIKDNDPYPVAKLGDIEIYFMHYHSEQDAAEKWYRRAKRVNPNHIIFKLSQREECSKKDIEDFMKLPLEHKICFAYDEVPGTVHIPELEGLVGDEMEIVNRYYDDLNILNE